jgi:hypothetical protein
MIPVEVKFSGGIPLLDRLWLALNDVDRLRLDPPLSKTERERVAKLQRDAGVPLVFAVAIVLGVYTGLDDLPKKVTGAHIKSLRQALLEQRTEVKKINSRKQCRDVLYEPPPKTNVGGRVTPRPWV